MRCWKRRGENASVSAHTNMVAKQCPIREGFGVQTSGSIGDVKETKRLVEQDEPVLVARHCSSKENRVLQSLQRCAVLRQLLVVSVIEPIESNRLVNACRHSRITRIVGDLYS